MTRLLINMYWPKVNSPILHINRDTDRRSLSTTKKPEGFAVSHYLKVMKAFLHNLHPRGTSSRLLEFFTMSSWWRSNINNTMATPSSTVMSKGLVLVWASNFQSILDQDDSLIYLFYCIEIWFGLRFVRQMQTFIPF
jgi:hypothetical protein